MSRLAFRRLFQFSLRQMLLLTFFATIMVGLGAIWVEPYRAQDKALRSLVKLGCNFEIRRSKGSIWRQWLVEQVVGRRAFIDVTALDLRNATVDDVAFETIKSMRHLESLVADGVKVSEPSLRTVAACRRLKTLSLRYTNCNDETMKDVCQLSNLQELHLTGTRISDVSVDNMKALSQLQSAFVRWTDMSEAGAAQLNLALPNCTVHY